MDSFPWRDETRSSAHRPHAFDMTDLNPAIEDVYRTLKVVRGKKMVSLVEFLEKVRQVYENYHDKPGVLGKRVEAIDSRKEPSLIIWDENGDIFGAQLRSYGAIECFLEGNTETPVEAARFTTEVVDYSRELRGANENEQLASTFPFIASDKNLMKIAAMRAREKH